MASIWMKASFDGTFNGDRCVVSGLDKATATKVSEALDAEFRDMHLAIEVWVD